MFFGWLVEEEEITVSPMARMKPPILPEVPCRCSPRRSNGRCWPAVTARRSTPAGIPPSSGSSSTPVCAGPSWRTSCSPTSTSTRPSRSWSAGAAAPGPVLRRSDLPGPGPLPARRDRHRLIDLPALWLTRFGAMTDSAIAQMVKRRGLQAGIDDLHPHVLRHTFAHSYQNERCCTSCNTRHASRSLSQAGCGFRRSRPHGLRSRTNGCSAGVSTASTGPDATMRHRIMLHPMTP